MVSALPNSVFSMPTVEPEPDGVKSPPTKNIKVKVATANALADIAEATGQKIWQVVEELVAAELPGYHAAVQAKLREVRKTKARVAEIQRQARKDRGE